MILQIPRLLKVESVNSIYLSSGSCKTPDYIVLYPNIYKQIVSILSCSSDSVHGGMSLFFKHKLYISALEQVRVLLLANMF